MAKDIRHSMKGGLNAGNHPPRARRRPLQNMSPLVGTLVTPEVTSTSAKHDRRRPKPPLSRTTDQVRGG